MGVTSTVCEIPPRNRKSTQLAVGWIFIVLTTLALGLRLMARPPLSASFGIDDGIGIGTYVQLLSCTALVDMILMIQGANLGWGTDMWALQAEQIILQMKVDANLQPIFILFTNNSTLCQLFYAGIIAFYLSVSLAKLSILFFYLRIFTTDTFKRIAYTMIFLCSAYGVGSVVTSILDCMPPSYFWTRFDGVSTGYCVSKAAFKVIPPVNIALDVVVMVLPLPLLARLNLPLQKKIRVLSMFSMGVLIIVADILRITHLFHSITAYNITYNGGELSYFGVIESGVGVICICMPAIAALLKRVLPQCFGSLAKRSYLYRTINSRSNTEFGASRSRSQRGAIQPSAYAHTNPNNPVSFSAIAWGAREDERDGDGNTSDIHLTLLPATEIADERIQRPQKALTSR
ncbi:hypothetical protein AN9036.2 [Aspergillus nidulans FGSC A4]|uniref:Rhodopsin domain-containing protein n=1 Tax=Emericella nidulans (strain FGSC A4 / ATCC 38163 / CBS 112.46 / NRRL 194 / M139) TaxID=227321 RepID=Q5ARP4_EMENI|nr:hypothetical protein [Aspergillus nidulans FGSC A4]EAA64368.1 hypothetical protein AN9036.2 [Aspergillus nidulans FGSC A4]CBF84417.1 TPA: conserved hypothetical protein [Aspergillus nidulans FGSC A4]|eukprot:XP_682305.1 hypothetical protein AN9036.2 [Aspergillus nidulans FGSC A4]